MWSQIVLIVIDVFSLLGSLARAEDHLEPETGIFTSYDWEWVYARNIRENLLKDMGPCHQARMVCCPSFAPEWVVSVVREGEGELFTEGTRDYFVEYVEAHKQIWNDEKKTVKVGVKRVRVSIDRATAETVSEVWRLMLVGVRHPGEQNRSEDGVTYHFSRAAGPVKGGPPSGHGEGKAWMPDVDKFIGTSGELAAIGVALRDYANAKPDNREKLASRIHDRAIRLRDQLGQPKQPG